jgi:hypothetical protein
VSYCVQACLAFRRIAVAENSDITRALCDAKRELIWQIEHQKSVRVPMSNRELSATIRHPDSSVRPQNRHVETQSTARPRRIERQI